MISEWSFDTKFNTASLEYIAFYNTMITFIYVYQIKKFNGRGFKYRDTYINAKRV